MDLDGLDLNILVSLDALLSEKNVTRAAERVFVSQPAMSAALQKLRQRLSDPLLERAGRKMELTPRARSLAGPVKELLFRIQAMLAIESAFDPATAQRKFSLVMSAYCAEIFGAPLAHRIAGLAPNVSCQIDDLSSNALTRVYEGQVDVCIAPSQQDSLDDTYRVDISCEQYLFADLWVLIGDRDNRLLDRPMSYETFCAQRYAETRLDTGVVSMVEQTLARRPARPITAAWMPNYLNTMAMIGGTDLLAIVPSRLFTLHGEHFRLRAAASPLLLPAIDEIAIWHPRNEADPAHRWMIGILSEVASGMPPTDF